jgi:hypothetical protein
MSSIDFGAMMTKVRQEVMAEDALTRDAVSGSLGREGDNGAAEATAKLPSLFTPPHRSKRLHAHADLGSA